MTHAESVAALRAIDGQRFEEFVADVIRSTARFRQIECNVTEYGHQLDIVAEEDTGGLAKQPTRWYFDVRGKSTPLSQSDIQSFGAFSHVVRFSHPTSRFVIVSLSPSTSAAKSAAEAMGIEIWDPSRLVEIAAAEVVSAYIGAPPAESVAINHTKAKADSYRATLLSLSPGEEAWLSYQTFVRDVLEFLFCPPLDHPESESTDADRRNRRDVIFGNGAPDGFWAAVRLVYDAHYVVVDAKNYSQPIAKRPILDMAHYLKSYGCGLFGIVVCRRGASVGGQHAIREQWIASRKMIIVVDDDDIFAMLQLKIDTNAPEEFLRERIRKFRLSL